MKINPLTSIDFYKADHRRQYPTGTTEVYSNFTPRSSRLAPVLNKYYDNTVVFFGLQYFIKHFLIDVWNREFFHKEKAEVVNAYQRRMDYALGKDAIETQHIEALHDLGYLPLKIKALPEGASVSIGVPLFTIVNTHPDFFWLTNYVESVMSCHLWKACTSATTAFEYKKCLTHYAIQTGSPLEQVPFQVHDFSFRGNTSLQDSALTGAAHLTSFFGTDSVVGVDLLEDYYAADVEHELVGASVPATEHSVMSMAEQNNEFETFHRLITDIYPTGVVSIVSDTWDFWRVVTEFSAKLKDVILAREGKVVFRPDSGDPINIICGDPDAPYGSAAHKGVIECLWEVFGGTLTSTGHRLLDSHVGIIYGDSITLLRADRILKRLAEKNFASGNIFFGVGSSTYQHVTRDYFGFAMKVTSGVVNGQRRDVFKAPKTDVGVKHSARGLLRVEKEDDRYVVYDQQTPEQEAVGELRCVFVDGQLQVDTSLQTIRQRINARLKKLSGIEANVAGVCE